MDRMEIQKLCQTIQINLVQKHQSLLNAAKICVPPGLDSTKNLPLLTFSGLYKDI